MIVFTIYLHCRKLQSNLKWHFPLIWLIHNCDWNAIKVILNTIWDSDRSFRALQFASYSLFLFLLLILILLFFIIFFMVREVGGGELWHKFKCNGLKNLRKKNKIKRAVIIARFRGKSKEKKGLKFYKFGVILGTADS